MTSSTFWAAVRPKKPRRPPISFSRSPCHRSPPLSSFLLWITTLLFSSVLQPSTTSPSESQVALVLPPATLLQISLQPSTIPFSGSSIKLGLGFAFIVVELCGADFFLIW